MRLVAQIVEVTVREDVARNKKNMKNGLGILYVSAMIVTLKNIYIKVSISMRLNKKSLGISF